jgi:putative sterol carrier protein
MKKIFVSATGSQNFFYPRKIKKEKKMSLFKDTNHMYEFLEDLWKHIVFEAGLGEKMREYGVTYKYILTEPDGYLFVDPDNVITGEAANKDAVITMELSGDTVVKFWTKQLSLPVALATRKIKSKGPIPKVLKMLPALKPVFEIFPEFCKKHNVPLN